MRLIVNAVFFYTLPLPLNKMSWCQFTHRNVLLGAIMQQLLEFLDTIQCVKG